MYSSGAHIVTRCEWNTAFDSKQLATVLQTYISKWSTYKMQRIINSVFDRFCPEGQTLKIKKLSIDLGAITYENMERELPIRLKDALYDALYSLIMYPKNGGQEVEVINAAAAQLNILKTFLLEGILPWNYHESYGSANQIMQIQLAQNRLEVIQLIQEIGTELKVRKRIAWQFNEPIIKKIITGLEPNNHQQIIRFSEEFVKVQQKENVLKTSTQAFKKNLWLWILNYLFVDRGTIFNKIDFVRSTITQIANHFNISYDSLVELIEIAIYKNEKNTIVNKDFITILKLLSEELHHKSYAQIKTHKQQENFWKKVITYFSSASARSNSAQKNEFNELVINLSKLDASRFQKILLQVEQKPAHWEAILTDLIPAAIENLFIALSPSQSKNVLTQIDFLTSLDTEIITKIKPIQLYSFGIEFCVTHQSASVSKRDFLTFVIEKIAKQQQQSTFEILRHFIGTTGTTQQKASFIPLFKELKHLFQEEITTSKVSNLEKLNTIVENYMAAISKKQLSGNDIHALEQKVLQWIEIAPKEFWNTILKTPKTTSITAHITTLIATYGTQHFLKKTHPNIAAFLQQITQILEDIIVKNPKHAKTIRTIKRILIELGFAVIWEEQPQRINTFFVKLLVYVQKDKTVQHNTDLQEVIQLLLKHPKVRTIGFSSKEFAGIQQQYKVQSSKTILTSILEFTQEKNQQQKVASLLNEVVRTKKIYHPDFQKHTAKIINYLLTNGVQTHTELTTTFLKEASNLHTSETQKIVTDSFWQTLVMYNLHQGNEQKFRTLFEETINATSPKIQFEKGTVTITEAIQQKASKTTVASLLKKAIKAGKIQHTISQKQANSIITYILKNGIQIRETLFTKFTTILSKTLQQTHTAIQVLLENCFWETLASYHLYKGNEQEFCTLFETQLFEILNKKSIINAIQQNTSKEQVATLLNDCIQSENIQSSDFQKHAKEITSYFLVNGVQIRAKLVATFLDKILKTKPGLHKVEIQKIIDNCFWKTLAMYPSYKGSEQEFSMLFEANLTTMLSKLKTTKNETSLVTPIKLTTNTLFEMIETSLQKGKTTIVINKRTYSFSDILILGLETSPSHIRTIIQHNVSTKKQFLVLQNSISFEEFITLISKDLSSSNTEIYKSFYTLFVLAKHFGNAQIVATLTNIFWKEAIAMLQSKSYTQKQLKKLVKVTFDELSNIETLDLLTIVKYIQRNRISVSNLLKNTLISHHTIFEAIASTTETTSLSKAIKNCLANGKIEALSKYLITQFTIPAWFQHHKSYSYEVIVHTLLSEQPLVVLKTIRNAQISEVQLTKLSRTVRFSILVQTLIKLYPLQQKRLADLERLYESMGMISITGIATKELQDVLSRKVWKAWQTSHWSLLTHTNIWNELLWETCGKKSMRSQDFVKAIQSIKASLPTTLQVTFTNQFPNTKKVVQLATKTLKQKTMEKQNASLLDVGIAIPNAGLVLLNSYFLMLMERLEIVSDKQFKSEEDQENAVHYLQYIVTGLTETEESLLVLNKVLAGLSPNTPVKNSIDMTEDEKQLIDGMILAATNYWSAIGKTSIDGFRGNWLVRDGILRETEERWELTVEKRPYDVLMLKSPFSFSIIKLPWMEKPLHVTWPF